MNSGRHAFHGVVALAAAAGAILLAMPAVLPPYPLFILSYALIVAIACAGLNVLYGTSGLLSLGHAAYFGTGAYTGAFLYRFFGLESLEAYLFSGTVAAGALAAAVGFLCVRATKIHFAILTLSFSMVLHALIIDGAIFALFGPLGWALYLVTEGSMYVPRLTVLGVERAPNAFVPVLYNVIALSFVVTLLLLRRIDRSPFGLALRGVRDSESRAAFVGVAVARYRWAAFLISGTTVGFAGALYGPLARQITPEQLHWLFSANLLLATALGGARRFLGPVLGAFLYVGLDEYAVSWIEYRGAVFGMLLILVIFAIPGGLIDLAARAAARLGGRARD